MGLSQTNEYYKEWYRKNLVRERIKRKESSRRYRVRYPESIMFYHAKNRAKEKGLPFNLDLSDIIIPEKCPVFQVEFQTRTPYAATLDRIIPELGYVKGNIQVISRRANVMKNDASQDDLERFARWALKR